jgi:T5SS/PEP-CTERM-associated repeat protein
MSNAVILPSRRLPAAMRSLSWASLAFTLLATLIPSPAAAAITPTGDVFSEETAEGYDFYYVGYDAVGGLQIDSGSVLSTQNGFLGYNATARGTATVTGTGSEWATPWGVCVGMYGAGDLTIADGARADTGRSYLGQKPGSSGVATVSGVGSQWSCDDEIIVGYHGDGALNIHNGGKVVSANGEVGTGTESTATATISGTGSQWYLSWGLAIGVFGKATLMVSDGALLHCSYGSVGHAVLNLSGDGTATITGPGSQWVSEQRLNVGSTGGTGTFYVANGGHATCRDVHIGRSVRSTGTAMVSGTDSGWTVTDQLFVGHDGAGTLTIEDGGLVSVGGQLTIDDDQDGNAAVRMQSDGMLALFGDADDSLAQFLGLVAGSDAIEYWNGQAWSHLSNGILGTDYSLDYITAGDLDGYTTLTVHTYVPMLGDIDGDGDVDNMDIGMATGNFTGAGGSTTMTWADGDMDGDGDVDNVDIGTITGAFTGAVLPDAPSFDTHTHPVPEPTTLALLALTGLAIVRRKAAG